MPVGKRLFRQVVGRQRRLLGVGGRQGVTVRVVHRAVVREQFRLAVARVVRMREAEVDVEGTRVLLRLALGEVGQHLLGVPRAAGLVGPAAFGGVVTNCEPLVRRLVAVALLTGPHRRVAGAVEHGGNRLIGQVRRTQAFLHRLRRDGQVPHRAAAHDHMTRRRADGAGEGAHVVRAIQRHALRRETVKIRRLQRRGRVVHLEVERRLVVDEDEQDVRPLGRLHRLRRPGLLRERTGQYTCQPPLPTEHFHADSPFLLIAADPEN